jgi:hypothetical protein
MEALICWARVRPRTSLACRSASLTSSEKVPGLGRDQASAMVGRTYMHSAHAQRTRTQAHRHTGTQAHRHEQTEHIPAASAALSATEPDTMLAGSCKYGPPALAPAPAAPTTPGVCDGPEGATGAGEGAAAGGSTCATGPCASTGTGTGTCCSGGGSTTGAGLTRTGSTTGGCQHSMPKCSRLSERCRTRKRKCSRGDTKPEAPRWAAVAGLAWRAEGVGPH